MRGRTQRSLSDGSTFRKSKRITACAAINGFVCVFALFISLVVLPTFFELTFEGQAQYAFFLLGTFSIASSTFLLYSGKASAKTCGRLSEAAGLFFLPLFLTAVVRPSGEEQYVGVIQLALMVVPLATGFFVTRLRLPASVIVPETAQEPKLGTPHPEILRPRSPVILRTTDPNLIMQAHRNGKWDIVLGFDFLSFIRGIRSEEIYRQKMTSVRDKREGECAKKGKETERLLIAISEAYGSLVVPEKRTRFLIMKTVNEAFYGWGLGDLDKLKQETLDKVLKTYSDASCYTLDWIRGENTKNKIELEAFDASCYEIGFHLSRNGKKEESIKFLTRAVTLHPDDPMACHWCGSTLSQLKRWSDALPHLRKAVTLRSDGPNNHWLGTTLGQLGRWQEALPYLRVAVTKESDATNNFFLGHCLCKLGRWYDSLPYLRLACTLNPNDLVCRQALAIAEQRCHGSQSFRFQ